MSLAGMVAVALAALAPAVLADAPGGVPPAPPGPGDGLVLAAGAPAGDRTAEALEVLAAAAEDGLDPADYDAAGLARRVREATGPGERHAAEAAVEGALLRFLADLAGGRVEPGARGLVEDAPAARLPDAERAGAALAAARPREAAAALRPRLPAYARLAGALARWRDRARRPEPPPVPPVARVRPGEPWEGVPALRARLGWLGELATAAGPEGGAGGAPAYAGDVVAAVTRFQARHGLAADGVVGKGTVEALNVPAAGRVRQIELAMERLRWFPDPGARLVHVEVPRAVLEAVDLAAGGTALRMRVVVGRGPDRPTPLLATEITGVVFRPFWVPPPKILKEEILPAARRKPGWLEAHGMEVVASGETDAPPLPADEASLAEVERGRLTLRQRPGPRNDLGPVKFVVPNPACIGLHGTPHRRLFERPRRDRSHGCVRLEDPVALADWALAGADGWDAGRIERALARPEPTWVRLPAPVALAVSYATASADPDGTEHFTDDRYGLDAALDRLLSARAPPRPDAGAAAGGAPALSAPRER